MILADTSIWIDHLRSTNAGLSELLERGEILMHPFIRGELILGGLPAPLGADLRLLPQSPVATAEEIEALVAAVPLYGRGIGYVDAALLASVRLHGNARLWTSDRKLSLTAAYISVDFTVS